MKTRKTIHSHILTVTVLLLSATSLLANADGYLLKKSSSAISIELRGLTPSVPEFAEFSDSGLTSFPGNELNPTDQLLPGIPAEATFDEQIGEEHPLNPVVPEEAPYHEIF